MSRSLGAVDVVVLGGGPGGMAAALAAAERGLSVGIVERLPELGGNLPHSSGYVALADTDLQREQGVVDSAECFLDDLRRERDRAAQRYGATMDDDVAALYASRSAQVHRWLRERGVDFRTLISRPAKHSVPRIHALADPSAATAALCEQLERHEVYPLLGLRVVDLETSPDGPLRLTVTDERNGQPMTAEARLAVVVATGGYQANFRMRAEIQPPWLAETPYLGIGEAVGDGHGLLVAAGARMVNMDVPPAFGHVATSITEQAVAVNLDGERFHDETDPYETPTHLERQPERRGSYVFDDATLVEKRAYVDALGRKVTSADTLAELAEKLHVPADALRETVARFNAAVAEGDASGLSVARSNLPRRPIGQGPFHALEVVIGISVSYGGAATTPQGRVVGTDGEVLPRLYAVGNANGSLAAGAEVGGVNLGGSFVLGHAVGNAIADDVPADVPADARA